MYMYKIQQRKHERGERGRTLRKKPQTKEKNNKSKN